MNNKTFLFLAKEISADFQNLIDLIKIYLAEQVSKGYDLGFEDWLKHQEADKLQYDRRVISLLRKHKGKLDAEFISSFIVASDYINEQIQARANALGKEAPLAYKEIKKGMLSKAKETMNNIYSVLVTNSLNAFDKMIKGVSSELNWSMKEEPKIKQLFSVIKKNGDNLENAISVTYKNGRKASFKNYVEMKVRTSINEIANQYLDEASNGLGLIFHLCNHLEDSAKDHAPHQGKVYVIENWRNYINDAKELKQIDAYIKNNGIQTKEWVMDKPAFLTTRPNCRHFFKPINYEQALNYKETLKTLKMAKNEYSKEKYTALQEQRYNERQIREFKGRVDNRKALLNNARPEEKNGLMLEIRKYNKRIKMYQGKQRLLIDKNPHLRRQYIRENPKKIAYEINS